MSHGKDNGRGVRTWDKSRESPSAVGAIAIIDDDSEEVSIRKNRPDKEKLATCGTGKSDVYPPLNLTSTNHEINLKSTVFDQGITQPSACSSHTSNHDVMNQVKAKRVLVIKKWDHFEENDGDLENLKYPYTPKAEKSISDP